MAVARPIVAALDLLEELQNPDESDGNGPYPDEIKAYLEDALGENHGETERLSDEIKLEGRMLLGSNCRGTPEVPSISISWCDLRIPVSTLRVIVSSTSLHETSQASDCHPEDIWHTSSDLFGRSSALSLGSSRALENLPDCNHPFHRPRVCHQTRKVLTLTHASNHLSRCTAELDRPYNSCSSGEALPHTGRVQRDSDKGMVLHAGTLGSAGSAESDCVDWDLGSTIAHRALQRMFIAALHRKGHFTRSKRFQIPLTKEASSELKWWSSEKLKQLNGMALNPPGIDVMISTDASKKGWGPAFLANGQGVGGRREKTHTLMYWNSRQPTLLFRRLSRGP